jgi:predicted permease
MSRWRTLGSWARTLLWRSRVERDLEDELEFHIDEEIAAGLRAGLTIDESRRRAYATLGAPPTLIREQVHDQRGISLLDDFVRDLKHGARLLLRTPQFAVVVLVTLAVAIGAVVSVFSIVDAWLVKPLNFPGADRLVIAFAARPERPTEPAVWLPYRAYLGWKERSRTLTSISAASVRDVTVTTASDAQTVLGLTVTPEFLGTLGVRPILGRTVSQGDETGPPVVVLSHGLWQRFFGGSEQVIGAVLTMSGVPHEVIGVMPRDFDVRVLDMRFDFWVPLRHGAAGYEPGGLGPVAIIGRLREGADIIAAQSEVASITRQTESSYQPNFNQFIATLSSLQADNTRTVRATLLTVSVAVVCLLLITSTNVGTLLLGRGLARMRETAVRTALGCGRGRLLRQFLTESLLIAFLGAAGGLAVATIAIRLFVAWNPLGNLPGTPIALDIRAVFAAAIAMAATTLVSGLMPAFRVSLVDPNDALRTGDARGPATVPAQRAQSAMLAVQMGGCLVLLVASVLMVRTFSNLQNEPLGFDPDGLFVANVVLPNDPFDSGEKRNMYYRQLSDRLRALAGVRAVAAGTSRPLNSGAPVTVYTGTEDPANAPRISAQEVTTEFFDTLGIPLVAGRSFDERDSLTGASVIILNARAAQELFGSPRAAVGRRVRLNDETWREIVGVVGNVRSTFFNTLEWKMDPIVYGPAQQGFETLSNPTATSFGFHLHVRAERPLAITDVRNAAATVNAHAAVTELRKVSEVVQEATRQPAFRMTLLLAFAGISVLLAAIGTFGVVSQAVTQRRREIAVRLALGAEHTAILRSIVRRALVTSLAGLLIGTAAALAAGHVLQTLVYGVRPGDPMSLIAAGSTLCFATVAGALIPAFRVMAIDPATVLRGD